MLDLKTRVQDVVILLLDHMAGSAGASYDYYDWWATAWGGRIKQWAYQTEPVGHLVFSGPLLALELWLPMLRRPLGLPKRVYPITLAQSGLSYVALYQATGLATYLSAACNVAERLAALAINGAPGMCWGFPFTWTTNLGTFPPNIPAVTQTAYGYDLFENLWVLTRDPRWLQRLLSVAEAIYALYVDVPRGRGVAHTYLAGGIGDVVVNAVTYRAHVLAAASEHGRDLYRFTAMGLVDYALDRQCPDGSWLYGEAVQNCFIDHYHTCFVLKNLARANRVLQRADIDDALQRGIAFLQASLLDRHGLPRPYAKQVHINPVRHQLYDFAEHVSLFSIFSPQQGFTDARLCYLVDALLRIFRRPDGALRSTVYRLPTATSYPYYRFGMSAATLALARLLNRSSGSTGEGCVPSSGA